MAITNPTLQHILSDDSPDVEGFTVEEIEFTFDKVAGGSFPIVNTDGFITVGGHNITTVERILIFSSNLTASGTLRINHDPGGGAVDKDIPFTGYLMMKVPGNFAAQIALGSGLSLSTDQTIATKYTVRVFGS